MRKMKSRYAQGYTVSLQQNLVRKFECTLALGSSHTVLLWWLLLFCLFVAKSLYAASIGIQLVILLSQPPEGWNYRQVHHIWLRTLILDPWVIPTP